MNAPSDPSAHSTSRAESASGSTIGFFGVGALISFVVGGLLMFHHFDPQPPSFDQPSVSLWVLGATTAVLAAGGGWLVYMMFDSTRVRVPTSSSRVVGLTGRATTDLVPRGTVLIASDVWSAVSDSGESISEGESVEAVALEELTVRVRRAEIERS